LKILGIIAEYNPFHNGHIYQIEKAKEITKADFVIVVLSGSFTQRCEPSIFSKWARTNMALNCGVDLVIELPFPFSTASAEGFARGGVSLLTALRCVDYICFSSESGDIEQLIYAKNAVISPLVDEKIMLHLKSGITYAVARQKAVKDVFGVKISKILESPNNILAVEYLKALDYFSSKIKPFTIKRIGSGHNQEGKVDNYSSASFIRKQLLSRKDNCQNTMPLMVNKIIENEIDKGKIAQFNELERAIILSLRVMGVDKIKQTPQVNEGIQTRIYNACVKANNLEQLYELAKTKRYTMSRIRRTVLWAFIGIKKQHIFNRVPYIRVLGFNDNGRIILRKIKKNSKLPIITKPSFCQKKLSEKAQKIFDVETKASELWSLCCKQVLLGGLDRTESPIYYRSQKSEVGCQNV